MNINIEIKTELYKYLLALAESEGVDLNVLIVKHLTDIAAKEAEDVFEWIKNN